jgi:hypothetical protein
LARDEIKLEDVTLGKGAFGTVTKVPFGGECVRMGRVVSTGALAFLCARAYCGARQWR